MRSRVPALVIALSILLASCGNGRRRGSIFVEQPRLVSILVEVYDPDTNLALDGVSVRIAESDQEWSGCTCVNPYDDWYLTDSFGRVLLDEYALADARVGFLEDEFGAAILYPNRYEDEALVVLEIDAVGYAPLFVEVPLSWDEPDVFVEVPFF